eukprot:3233862-Ditylum_brightwellii.AAC.2
MMGGIPRDKVLKLNKSLYGQADAPMMWYDKLRAILQGGWKQVQLGDNKGRFCGGLTQEGLIDKILKASGMENFNPAVAPTSGPKPLGPDPHSKGVQLQDSGAMFQWLE